jgi:hypothetical protein
VEAREAGESAAIIAQSVAALGTDGVQNEVLADRIWQETLSQMDRIQRLHGLPRLEFQIHGRPKAGPPAAD